jgi:hypothetical protein
LAGFPSPGLGIAMFLVSIVASGLGIFWLRHGVDILIGRWRR